MDETFLYHRFLLFLACTVVFLYVTFCCVIQAVQKWRVFNKRWETPHSREAFNRGYHHGIETYKAKLIRQGKQLADGF